jgi:hypothetical protein
VWLLGAIPFIAAAWRYGAEERERVT